MVSSSALNTSCENMANFIHKAFKNRKRKMKIEVSEDGENGVEFYYD